MRVVGLVVIALTVVSATQQSLAPELVKQISNTKLGTSILLELQEAQEAAPSLQGLLDLVADIRKRIEDAQDADEARNGRRQQICEDDLWSLRTKINNTIEAIKVTQGQIAETSMQVGRLTRAIKIMQDRIVLDRQTLHKTRVMLGNNTRIRYMDNAIYKQRVIDTEAAQSAVAEILALDWELLINRQGDESANFADQTLDNQVGTGINDKRADVVYNANGDIIGDSESNGYVGALISKLNSAAASIKDPTAAGFLQVASLAIAGLNADDVQRLKDLLNKLADELTTYRQELETEEVQQAADWNQAEADLRAEIQTLKQMLADDISEETRLTDRRADAEEALTDYQLRWSGLKESYTGNPDAPGALEILETATTNECENWQAAFDARTSVRSDELGTVAAIEAIIKQHMTDYVEKDTAKYTDEGLQSNGDYAEAGTLRTSYN